MIFIRCPRICDVVSVLGESCVEAQRDASCIGGRMRGQLQVNQGGVVSFDRGAPEASSEALRNVVSLTVAIFTRKECGRFAPCQPRLRSFYAGRIHQPVERKIGVARTVVGAMNLPIDGE